MTATSSNLPAATSTGSTTAGVPGRGSRRQVGYRWRLREVMALHGLFATTDLVPLLASRGIDLSPSQVHRIVVGTPERLSMPVLAALCDIFDADPGEFIVIDPGTTPDTMTGTMTPSMTMAPDGGSRRQPTLDLAARRPVRARITAPRTLA